MVARHRQSRPGFSTDLPTRIGPLLVGSMPNRLVTEPAQNCVFAELSRG